MQALPPLTPAQALFLDFDGTLAELAPRPDAVQVAPGLVATLAALHTRLDGALAMVTGRSEADIDHFLAPLRLALACEHGARYRHGLAQAARPAIALPDLAPVLHAAKALAAQHPELLLEHKSAGLALHYRQAPQLQSLCRDTLERAMQAIAGVELLQGKCVLEVKPRGVHKGRAIADFMAQPPFAGRTPVFAGDDATDEAGFAAAQALGGWGIKVGPGPSVAQHRCTTPAALRGWLSAAGSTLEHGTVPGRA
ncbi:trehalose-phosphatase [Verminephrobacter aporrectodeae]|uniref:trehalose-phosphatase n=1 Tax=Verminephrobacter aporrectodeae TaxID=1110389 RepID=UPI002243AAAA|nr:trehalose-phosphatase [Verminephrobacter aporrectodeae]MCW8175058.1 trehalose-phosphatase [Verminephrobacter aporrectodeae subsp. tuberculatae]MCW8202360.1 trehalose-phosphatase [Verminephrobacter aporrectodeae subsp. tuberculatae]